jgi:hypothetical protein
MKIFESSRLTKGNRLFPSRIEIDNNSVSIIFPSLLKSKSETINFNQLSSVKFEMNAIWFSKIIFETTGGGRIFIEGFTKSEIKEIKEIIY